MTKHPAEYFTSNNAQPLGDMMAHILETACPDGDGEPDREGWRTYLVETHCSGFRIVARRVRDGRVQANTPGGYDYPGRFTPEGFLPDADGWQIKEYGVYPC